MLAIYLVPPKLMAKHRAAAVNLAGLAKIWMMGSVIILLWMIGMTFLGWLFVQGIVEKKISQFI